MPRLKSNKEKARRRAERANKGPRKLKTIGPEDILNKFKGELAALEAQQLPALHASYGKFDDSMRDVPDTFLAGAVYESLGYLRQRAKSPMSSVMDHQRRVGCTVIAINGIEEALRRWGKDEQ